MGWFGNKKRPINRRGHKNRTPEQIKQRAEAERAQFAVDSLKEMTREDPELKRQVVLSALKIDFAPIRPSDELEDTLDKEAIDVIKNDPELRQRLARERISKFIPGRSPVTDESGDGNYNGPTYETPAEQALGALDLADEIRARAGGGRGGIAALFTPDVVVEALRTLQTLAGPKVSSGIPSRMYVVQVDGQQTLTVDEAQYQLLTQQGKIQPVATAPQAAAPSANGDTPKQEPPVQVEQTIKPVIQ